MFLGGFVFKFLKGLLERYANYKKRKREAREASLKTLENLERLKKLHEKKSELDRLRSDKSQT